MNKDINNSCFQYLENKNMIDELTSMNEGLKHDIISLMYDNDVIYTGSHKITYNTVTSTHIDSAALKAAEPAIYNRYSKKTSYKRLIVK